MMNKINYNRRNFLQHSALGVTALSLFPKLLIAQTNALKSQPTASFKADVEIEITSRNAYIPIREGRKTKVQKYYATLLKGPKNTVVELENNYLGPTLNYKQGQKVRIYYKNRLTESSVIHWHGLHVPQHSDGHPMYTINGGETLVYEFEVLNGAGTSFYHSHAHEATGPQIYNGLSGLITVTDKQEQALDLPRGEYDLPFVLQDKTLDQQNQLQYLHGMHDRMMGFLGETILVNGQPNAAFSVKSRAYRFRAVNSSNSRIYKLAWSDGTPLTAIGTDGNLLKMPETRPYLMLSPGERIDLWLDFSGRSVGDELTMLSLAYQGSMPPKGSMMMRMSNSRLSQGAEFIIASFKVTKKVKRSPVLPKHLANIKRLSNADVDNKNKVIPIAISMKPMRPQLNGHSYQMDRVEAFERVELGSIKKIKIFHEHEGMMLSMAHPIHLHGQQFQIISRKMKGMRKEEYKTVSEGFIDSGWKDTVLVMPGEEITIIKPFQDFKGLFLYHCHNLEHEDLGMMRQFYIS
jgi:bilirubin oxidase